MNESATLHELPCTKNKGTSAERDTSVFVMAMRDLALRAQRGELERFQSAPRFAPRARLDETRAARSPVLKWTPRAPWTEAAE